MKKNKYIAIAFIITTFVVVQAFAQPYRISGDCMEPAIMDGRLYFLDRVSPYLRPYKTGDIVLFSHEGKVWISRVVALESNIIQISEGNVIVNDAALPESEIQRTWTNWKHGTYAIDSPLEVPLGHVFVLSDNLSAQHDDSRVFGPISKDTILGVIR